MFTIDIDSTNEIIIKNSRFITIFHKLYDIKDIEKYLCEIKKEYKDANHYCYAYIIDNNKKFDDNGEPSGTAGSPIMQVLEKNNLNYVICIVIRYFGGIKLGAGGLTRAYSKSACECLKKVNIITLTDGYNIDITFNYDYVNTINYLLKDTPILEKSFDKDITYNMNVSKELYENLINDKNITTNINKNIKIEIKNK